ncbi:CpsD/CapB family tyrosine-protein kinase [Vagococcus sp.]|uniref:CpsD/CapB family tyrosine-protein kinase n=1 Tax=Vagococcus sp. TaxID=1933889 RepID=UPI002FCA4122
MKDTKGSVSRMIEEKRSRRSKSKKGYSVTSEQFKLIRAGIDFSSIDQKMQVMVITSPESGTGKSTVASHLAVAYAQKGERTILIDADMRKPTLYKHFSKNVRIGLSNLLVGEFNLGESIQKVKMDDCVLAILTSGPTPPNPNDLLSSNRMSALIDTLKGSFDRIIIDTPPVTIVSDALILADLADGTVLVCRYQKTLKEKAKYAVNKLKLSKAKLIGVVFNGTKNIEEYYY